MHSTLAPVALLILPLYILQVFPQLGIAPLLSENADGAGAIVALPRYCRLIDHFSKCRYNRTSSVKPSLMEHTSLDFISGSSLLGRFRVHFHSGNAISVRRKRRPGFQLEDSCVVAFAVGAMLLFNGRLLMVRRRFTWNEYATLAISALSRVLCKETSLLPILFKGNVAMQVLDM